jgi:hypothetical protein
MRPKRSVSVVPMLLVVLAISGNCQTSAVAQHSVQSKAIVATENLKTDKFKRLSGYDIAGQMGIHAVASSDLGLKIDQARMQSDAISLGALASQLKYLEQLSGNLSSVVTSDLLFQEASLIIKAKEPYGISPIETKFAQGSTSQPIVSPGDPGPVIRDIGPTPRPLPTNPNAAAGPVDPRPSPTPSQPPRGSADVRGRVGTEGAEAHPGIPNVGAFVQVHNHTPESMHVILDGTYYGEVESGMYNTYAVHPGEHTVSTINASMATATKLQKLELGDTLYLDVMPQK